MAGRGPAPAGAHTRAENDRQLQSVISDGKLRGPALPSGVLFDADGNVRPWHKMTQKWWEHWRRSPQATQMLTDADWDFLLDTALLHDQVWTNGEWRLASEVRLRVQKFGATPEDRARLGVEIGRRLPAAPAAPAAGPGATVTSIDASRRAQITDAG